MIPHNLAARRRNAAALGLAEDLGRVEGLVQAAELDIALARKRLLETPPGLLPEGLYRMVLGETERACGLAIDGLKRAERQAGILREEAT